ncbi:cytochrome b [Polymorphobacter sp.]|uniref:cytochrome b n=1 Tax=Polymorphobacter sp. TaxID=1909290 RepID=UPI003F6EBD16
MDSRRYARASIVLHWLMLALFVAVYAAIESRTLFERGSNIREGVKSLHFMLGLTVFLLVWLRIAARLRWPAPPITPPPARWMMVLAHVTHGFLYLMMIAMPIAGWLILSGEGNPVPFWGLELPPLIAPDKDLAHRIEDVHKTVGEIGYWVIGLHALAALAHHYLWKDDTLRRMGVRR